MEHQQDIESTPRSSIKIPVESDYHLRNRVVNSRRETSEDEQVVPTLFVNTNDEDTNDMEPLQMSESPEDDTVEDHETDDANFFGYRAQGAGIEWEDSPETNMQSENIQEIGLVGREINSDNENVNIEANSIQENETRPQGIPLKPINENVNETTASTRNPVLATTNSGFDKF